MYSNRYLSKIVNFSLVLMSICLVFGCVKKPERDAFQEHWTAREAESEGYSPAPVNRPLELSRNVVTTPKKIEKQDLSQSLPTEKITLRMYDANIVTVLRAMARIAGQNVVFSSSIPGLSEQSEGKKILVNIDVSNAPWDQTFKSLLSSNKLAFEKVNGIIKIIKQEDIEAQLKIFETQNKLLREEDTLKKSEGIVVSRIPINYVDLQSAYNTVAMLCGHQLSGLKKEESADPKNDEVTQSGISKSLGKEVALQLVDSHKIGMKERLPGQLACSVVPDKHSNMLIVEGSSQDVEKILVVVNDIDKPPYQVKLKAIIVQTQSSTAQALGIQWGGILKNSNFQMMPAQTGTINSQSNLTSTGSTSAQSSTQTATGQTSSLSTQSLAGNSKNGTNTVNNTYTPLFGGGSSGQGFAINNPAQDIVGAATGLGAAGTGINFLFGKIGENVLEAQITALSEQGKAKVLSSPTITTMENHKAFIENGKEIPYETVSQQGTQVQFKNAVLKLEMIPHVVHGNEIRMNILVQDDQVDPDKNNWVQDNPPIFKKETRTNLVVEDGDTIIISGLTRDERSSGEGGVPFLKDIPGLGWAFKYKQNSQEKNDLLIFITPTILQQRPIQLDRQLTTSGIKAKEKD